MWQMLQCPLQSQPPSHWPPSRTGALMFRQESFVRACDYSCACASTVHIGDLCSVPIAVKMHACVNGIGSAGNAYHAKSLRTPSVPASACSELLGSSMHAWARPHNYQMYTYCRRSWQAVVSAQLECCATWLSNRTPDNHPAAMPKSFNNRRSLCCQFKI